MINVTKRDGSREPLDVSKLHKVVSWACEDIAGVSISEIELKTQMHFFNGIKTSDIQETLIKAAHDLITEDNPNYQYVASRLVNYSLRKEVYNDINPARLYDHVKKVVDIGFYDPCLLEWYTEEEFDALDKWIDHDRDYNIAFAGIEQFRGKYLVKNRSTNAYYETPQIAMMLIAASLFHKYPKKSRIKWVTDLYDAISEFDISLPTPIMAGVRTPKRQFSSCVLIEVADSLNSIIASTGTTVKYVANRAGIGLGMGSLRGVGSVIREGDAVHTGNIAFYKLLVAALKSCSQGGVRGGSGTIYHPIFHKEIQSLLVLKNNKGTEDNRIRHVDYGIQFNKLFYERLIKGENITLFSPNDVEGLYEAFFADQDKFRKLYEAAEKNPKIKKDTVSAIELFSLFIQERKDTGRIYLMNVDNVNLQGPFIPEIAPVRMSNLCFKGDTLVAVADSRNAVRIDELANDGSEFEVYSGWDEEVRKARAINTGTREMIRVCLEDGEYFECTPDHRIATTKLGRWIEAKDSVGELLEPFFDNMSRKVISIEEIGMQDCYDVQIIEKGLTDDEHSFYIITSGDDTFRKSKGVLVHNCAEIALPTKPQQDLHDEDAEVALCTLGAINIGRVRRLDDFKRPAKLLVRALDELLDFQDYPVVAAYNATMGRRPLGVGLINFAYFLAKNGITYQNVNQEQLLYIDDYIEAFSYYLIKASADLAKEKGACPKFNETKYSQGVLPIHTYSKAVDELTGHKEYTMPWNELIEQIKETGMCNSTLMAQMPAETSAQVSNSTNGVEPPRALVSVKGSKDGHLKQVVPEVRKYKNKYDLLWDQRSPKGYLKIMAVLQKYYDQCISVNTSYNPELYEDAKIPASELLEDILLHYKWGGKTLYYMNTFDGAGEKEMANEVAQNDNSEEEVCDGCTI